MEHAWNMRVATVLLRCRFGATSAFPTSPSRAATPSNRRRTSLSLCCCVFVLVFSARRPPFRAWLPMVSHRFPHLPARLPPPARQRLCNFAPSAPDMRPIFPSALFGPILAVFQGKRCFCRFCHLLRPACQLTKTKGETLILLSQGLCAPLPCGHGRIPCG